MKKYNFTALSITGVICLTTLLIVILVLSNSTGEAVKFSLAKASNLPGGSGTTTLVNSNQNTLGQQCPVCLRDYDIEAFMVTGLGSEAEFRVNGEGFILRGIGSSHTLSSGGRVILKSVSEQGRTGGLNGPTFHLEGLCSNQYTIGVFAINNNRDDGEYTVNGQYFVLENGGTKVLSNGNKIIQKRELFQPYAGGLSGLQFELIC